MDTQKETPDRPMPRKKAWSILTLTFFSLWLFGAVIGPWLQHHIYTMDNIVQIIDENGIDSGAYYYTEIEGAYSGKAYLNQALQMARPDQFGLTWPFVSGIVACLALLAIGFKYLPE